MVKFTNWNMAKKTMALIRAMQQNNKGIFLGCVLLFVMKPFIINKSKKYFRLAGFTLTNKM